jgi:hypothetical protein
MILIRTLLAFVLALAGPSLALGWPTAAGRSAALWLAQGAAPAGAADSPVRVRLVAPAVAAAQPVLALLRAELAAGGYLVDERPGAPGARRLDLLRGGGAFAAVIPDPAGRRAAAVVLVQAARGGPPRRHDIDLGPLAKLPESERLRRLTALAVRVSEVLQAHATARADSPGAVDEDDPLAPPPPGPADRGAPPAAALAAAPAAPEATPGRAAAVADPGRATASADPVSVASSTVGGTARADPASDTAVSAAGAGTRSAAAPEARSARATSGGVRLQAGLTAGRAVTGVGSAVGSWLALSLKTRRGTFAQVSAAGPSFARALPAPAGSVRLWGTLALLELGFEQSSSGRLSGFVAASAGVQHMLIRDRSAPGLAGTGGSWLSPAAGVSLGVGLRLAPSLYAIVSLRAHHLFLRPEIRVDATPIATPPRLLTATTAALQLAL